MINLEKTFEALKGQHLEFNQIDIEERPFSRPDLCAFARLDHLVASEDWSNIIYQTRFGIVFLNIDCDELAAVATEEDILYLARCGIKYHSGYDRLQIIP